MPTTVIPPSQTALAEVLAPVLRPEHAEGKIARLIEQQTAKLPSHWFLVAAAGAMVSSIALELSGRTREARFIGMWPTALMVAGVYTRW